MIRRLARVAGCLVVWAVVAVPVGAYLFVHTSQTTVLASHDTQVRATYDGYATLHLGPYLPDVRMRSGGPVGADLVLGKTEAASTEELVQRYAFIASNPDSQVDRARGVITDLALRAALRGAAIGVLPVGAWLLLGPDRRRRLVRSLGTRRGVAVAGVAVLVAVALVQPWGGTKDRVEDKQRWVSLGDLVPEVPLPPEARRLQVRADLTTDASKRLVASAVDTYDRSKTFYRTAAKTAASLELHQPADDETVTLLVSDRHDNIGMDAVAAAVAERGGASTVIDAGDDTSTGSAWEAFSLDSLDEAFKDDEDRWAIAGNHDNGTFVARYLADLGWTHLTGTVEKGPGGSRMMGVDDPRSSGLGTWRDEKGLSFAEQKEKIADAACAADRDGQRINTLVVHDANSAATALQRGCADLVLSGHLHVQVGPDRVVGENGKVGYRYTNGTTGGAAYAIAVGSKLRREAEVTLVTYAGGRPVGLQPVKLQTDGVFVVEDYQRLDLSGAGTTESQEGTTISPSPTLGTPPP